MNQSSLRRHWPWAILALLAGLAAWYVLDFEEDVDPEFPAVARPTFGRFPSPASRRAEPGDTLDRVGIYLAAGGMIVASVAALGAWRRGDPARPWAGAFAGSLAAFWESANPGPTFDGWHGLGWRAAAVASSPP